MKINALEYLGRIEFKQFTIETNKLLDLLISQNNSNANDEYLIQVHHLLALVYSLSWQLPELDLKREEDQDDPLSILDSKKYTEAIRRNLGDTILYNFIFDSLHDEAKDMVTGSILDDLGDIFIELKNAMLKIETNRPEAIEDGIWDILFGRNHHWGIHAINALRVLHIKHYN